MYGGVEGPDEKKNSDDIGFVRKNKLFVRTYRIFLRP